MTASKPTPRRPTRHDETDGTFTGPAGPFGTLKGKSKAFRGNAKTFAGRRQQSRERYVPVEPTE